jgi:AcrR family transcriptional regulator
VNSPDSAPASGTRERILAAALRCFLDGGYEQTTIAQIRGHSGVSNGALFHHFPTKEAIAEALYVDGIDSFQQGLREVMQRPPRSLLAAVRAVVGHQLTWTEHHPDHARFIYQRGHLDFDSPGGAAVDALNRDLATVSRPWVAPLIERGELRPVSMLLVSAIVTGPAHAIARRWLAGQTDVPLSDYADELALAACAALSSAASSSPGPSSAAPSSPASGSAGPSSPEASLDGSPDGRSPDTRGPGDAVTGRIRVELVDADGLVTGRGEATIRLARR